MQSIFLDESGYTGEDLLSRTQPVLVIATHALSEEECRELKGKYFGGIQAQELKHSKMCKRDAQQQMVLALLRDLVPRHSGIIKIGVAHKRFCLLMKIVDLVVETAMHQDGLDLYARGGNVALVNATFTVLDGLDPAYLDRVLGRFQSLVRERSRSNFEAFWSLIRLVHPVSAVEQFILPIRKAVSRLGYDGIFDGLSANALDLSLTMALVLVQEWRKTTTDSLQLVHDQSTNMSRQKWIWDALVDPAAPTAVVGYDTRTATFPIAVSNTVFSSSKDNVGLQIADVLAGAAAHLFGSLVHDLNPQAPYLEGLMELIGNQLPVHPLWPSDEIDPLKLGTVGPDSGDSLEYIGERLATAREKRDQS